MLYQLKININWQTENKAILRNVYTMFYASFGMFYRILRLRHTLAGHLVPRCFMSNVYTKHVSSAKDMLINQVGSVRETEGTHVWRDKLRFGSWFATPEHSIYVYVTSDSICSSMRYRELNWKEKSWTQN